jgi:hypothetical protein
MKCVYAKTYVKKYGKPPCQNAIGMVRLINKFPFLEGECKIIISIMELKLKRLKGKEKKLKKLPFVKWRNGSFKAAKDAVEKDIEKYRKGREK